MNLEQLKNKFIELVDIDIEDIVDVIEVDGNAMVYLKDKTKYAFLVEEGKVIPVEKKPVKKVEMVRDDDFERVPEENDEAYEEFEEKLLDEEIPDEYFEDLEDSEWDAIEEAVEKKENKEKVREAKKAAREKRLRAERERKMAEKSQYVDPTLNQETGNTYAQEINDEKYAELNKRLAEERRLEAQRQFEEALHAERLRIEAEKDSYAADIEKYKYKIGFVDENKDTNTAPDLSQTVAPKQDLSEEDTVTVGRKPSREQPVDEVKPEHIQAPVHTEEKYKSFDDVHETETETQRQAHGYAIINATFDGEHYVSDTGYKYKQEEVLVTPAGVIIDNRDNLYELDDKGSVLINATPVREPVAENFTILNATLKDDYYITENGERYGRDEVIVTHTGAIIDNRDNYYAINNNGHVVYNPEAYKSEPIAYKPLEVVEKDGYYVSNDGKQYKADEVLVTPSGDIVENRNKHYQLDDVGNVVFVAPVIASPVIEQVAIGYKTIEVVENNGDHFIADNGLRYKQEDVLVTHDGFIVDNRDNLYKLNHDGNVVVNTDTHKETVAQSYNIINATLEDNHYVADNGYRYKPEEVIVTKSGTIIDNRDNLYKLDNVGNVVVNDTPIREPIAQSYQVINARLEDNHYVADNGYRYRQDEVLVTKTGVIVDNRDNAYKLDSHGDVVINTAPVREQAAQGYSVINVASKTDDYYIDNNGQKFSQSAVLVTRTGEVIDNRDNLYKIDNAGAVVVNTEAFRERQAQGYSVVNATLKDDHYVTADGHRYRQEEVLVTKTGAVIDNRDNIYKLDNTGNVVINTSREPIAQGYNTVKATFDGEHYVSDTGYKYKQTEVLVTKSGTIVDNRDNLYKLDNTGNVVINTNREPIVQSYTTINATLKDNYYVADNGVKYRPEEVLVTKTGAIVDNKENLYKLDNIGNVVMNTSHVEKVATGYAVVDATFKDNSYITSDGRKFAQSEVLVTPTGTIINNKDNLYKLNSNGEVILNTAPLREPVAQSYQTITAKFDGEHYVSNTGYKYKPEEILVTQSGKLIDNRDNAFKMDTHGNVVVNVVREQAPQSYNTLNATFDGNHYVTTDGRRFEKSEVLVTATGSIINNRDNLYRLDNNGQVVFNTAREPVAQGYQTINATLKDGYYVSDTGLRYKQEDVLVTKTGVVIDNRDNIYKLDSVGNVVINSAPMKGQVANSYNVLEATYKDGAYVTTDGRRFEKSDVLVTATGTIINNKDNLYRLDNSGQVVLNTNITREPIAQGYNTVKATFDGTHYVSENGYKFKPEEILVTKTGAIVDNRDNLYKLDNTGNVIINRSYMKEQTAQSYNTLNATFKDGVYVTADGKKFSRDEVLVTKAGAIIDNRDNLYKLDGMGNVVMNKSEFGKTTYNPLSATFTGTHYITNDGKVYDKADVITLANGAIIENTNGRFKVDTQGSVVENRRDNVPFVIPQRAEYTSDMNAHYTIAGVPFLIDAKARQNNMSLHDTAHVVMKDLRVESTTLRTEILSARQELAKLKATGGNAEKIKELELLIKGKNERVVEIAGHQKRIEDFVKFGARGEFKITKESLEKAGYSKEHLQDLRKMGKVGSATDISNINKARGATGTTNIQDIHNNRVQALMGKFGGKFAIGSGRAFKRMMRDSDELREEVEIYDEGMIVGRAVSGHLSSAMFNKELAKLGFDATAINMQLEKIGAIAGVGKVSKMSLEELQTAYATLNLTSEAKRDLLEAIDLKKKLLMGNKDLAKMLVMDAGEYINFSTRRLQKLYNTTTDLRAKKQIEAALKYKKLSMLNQKAYSRWKATAGIAIDALRKFAQNDDNIATILNMSDQAMTGYRWGKTAYKFTKEVAKANAKKKAAEATGKKLVKTTMDVGKKQAATKAAHAANQQVIRTMATKESGKAVATGVGSKIANTRLGQTLADGIAKIKGAFIGGGSAAGAGAGAGAGATAGGAAGGSAALGAGAIAALVLLIILLVCACLMVCSAVYTMVFGDESNGTSVVEMVNYLQEKNIGLLEEIENKANSTPSKKDAKGNQLKEYTKVTYTYYDADGNLCMITDNTKEIISMAAVYFEQDFTDEKDVFKYLDEMWDTSHTVTYTESDLYGCGGNVCLNEDHSFNTSAQGFNAGYRTYYCYEDYTNIAYTDCFEFATEKDIRINTDKLSYRLPSSIYSGSDYTGINMRNEDSTKGYGCPTATKTETFYCNNIASITNTEVLARLVRATGINYNTLLAQKYCKTKIEHPGTYEGKPASGCSESECTVEKRYKLLKYNTLPEECPNDDGYHVFKWNSSNGRYEHTCPATGTLYYFNKYDDANGDGKYVNYSSIYVWWSASYGQHRYWIPYYTCNTTTGYCNGHNISYHYCDGTHQEAVCYGHVDLTVNVEVIGFDALFDIEMDKPQKQWKHKTTGEIINNSKYEALTNDEKAEYERYREDYVWTEDNIEWCKNIYNQNWKDLYDVYVPTSLYEYLDGVGTAIMPTNPNSLPIPLLNQLDFPNTPYSGKNGSSNIADSGCGLVCVAMLELYYNEDDAKSVPNLATMLGNYYYQGQGSAWSLFEGSANKLGHPFEKQTASWEEVVQALQDGKPVVSIQNENGPFTSGGHFILLTGITEDGKILVNDPNGANYNKAALKDGFENGFNQAMIQVGSSGAYWIYGVKETSETPTT